MSPGFGDGQHSHAVASSCWRQLKGQDEVAGGRAERPWASGGDSAGRKGAFAISGRSGVGRLPAGVLAEAAFPGTAPGRTIPGRVAEGSCRPLPPRKRTRWLWLLLLSLFLLFDLRRARSLAGSLSWPRCCLITCSEGRAEEEAGCFPGQEGLDRVGDAQTLLGTKPAAREWWGASTEPGCSQGSWKGCWNEAEMIPREVEVGMCIGCRWDGGGVGEPQDPAR